MLGVDSLIRNMTMRPGGSMMPVDIIRETVLNVDSNTADDVDVIFSVVIGVSEPG